MDVAEKRRPQDGRLKTKSPEGDEVELRLSTLPTAFGEKLVARIFEAVRELRDHGMTILLVEQNARAALRLSDRGYVMETGRITLAGTGQELLHDRRVQEAYLGE